MIEKQPPGLWFLFCDSCGERIELDTDPDDAFVEAVREAKEIHGYTVRRFVERPNRVIWIHTCRDCERDEVQKALKEAGL